MKAPFPYFGGKGKPNVVAEVWARLGNVATYIEPFCGSAAMLLARPVEHAGPGGYGYETCNDADGLLVNAWRAIQYAPWEVAHWADWPVSEPDLHARHLWLVGRRESVTERLCADPAWFDARAAGWWIWGACCWIGGGWCSGTGPWRVVDGRFVKDGAGPGVTRKTPILGYPAGITGGVKRQLPNLGRGRGTVAPGPLDANGLDVGAVWAEHVANTIDALSSRLRGARFVCGDWRRVVTSTPLFHTGTPTGVFLDPPYAQAERFGQTYAVERAESADVRAWAVEHGDDPRLRIALCGYDGEHHMPDTWAKYAWKATGGYALRADGRGKANAARERIWFSPHCVDVEHAQPDLFEQEEGCEPVSRRAVH